MACAGKCAKVLLIIFNVFFWLLGGGALAAGVLVLTLRQRLTGWLNNLNPTAGDIADSADEGLVRAGAITLCVVGGVILIIATLGCCGACRESKPMLAIYALVVFLLLAAEIAGAVVAYLMKDKVESYIQKFVNQTIVEKYEGLYFEKDSAQLVESINQLSDGVDVAQLSFACCGSSGPSDFAMATKWNKFVSYKDGAGKVHNVTEAKVPITCCKLRKPLVFEQFNRIVSTDFVDLKDCLGTMSEKSTNTKGCYKSIRGFLIDNIWIIFGIGIGIAFVQLFGMICACCLLFSKSDDDEKA